MPKDFWKYSLLCLQILSILALLFFNLNLRGKRPDGSGGRIIPLTIINAPAKDFGDILAALAAAPRVLSAAIVATPRPKTRRTYVIAAIGDSMIETMGDSLDYLQSLMRKKYPDANFVFYNYGIGAENVEQGIARFDKEFSRFSRHYPPLPDINPDIIIVGSYAYNPFAPYDRNKHWSLLADLIQKAEVSSKKVYVLAEIAPLEKGFGVGPGGVNWPDDLAYTQALHITEQLENSIGLAKTFGIGLIDADTPSRVSGSKFGRPEYVSEHDGIHPSVLGEEFMANLIASTISLP